MSVAVRGKNLMNIDNWIAIIRHITCAVLRWASKPSSRGARRSPTMGGSENTIPWVKRGYYPRRAMTGARDNDTSLWGWRSTRQRWDSYGFGS